MEHEQIKDSLWSEEAIALAAEVQHWIARHKRLVIVGTTAMALGFFSVATAVVHTLTTEYIPDIHESYLPATIYLGSHSICQLRPDILNGKVPVMHNNGGVTVGVIFGHIQVIHHAPEWRECTLPNQW